MKVDKDFAFFARHTDWYDVVEGVGYVPTEAAPQEAVKAIEAYNARNLQEVFIYHHDWYRVFKKIWYIPTEKAPPQAAKAMADYNAYILKTRIKDRRDKK